MSGLNKCMIIGRLGRDPEMRYTQSGTAICNLNIAASEQWKDKNGEKQERTEWVRATAFGKQAEILEKYLSKGSQLYLEGRMQTRKYEKDGQTHYVTEVVVKDFVFLGGGQQGQQNQGQQQRAQNYPQPNQGQGYDNAPPIDDSEIPF